MTYSSAQASTNIRASAQTQTITWNPHTRPKVAHRHRRRSALSAYGHLAFLPGLLLPETRRQAERKTKEEEGEQDEKPRNDNAKERRHGSDARRGEKDGKKQNDKTRKRTRTTRPA